MDPSASAEYLILRRTVALRGTIRPVLALIGTACWALTLTAVLVWLPYPVSAAIPLLILVATFEAIRPLHFGAERIGRYLQVFYEERGAPDRPIADTPSWERVAMRFGKVPGVGGHPLFVPLFLMCTITNGLAVALPGPVPVEAAVMAVPHLAFVAWLVAAHRAMKTQREIELRQLRQLASSERGGPRTPTP